MTGALEQLAARSVAGDRAALDALCRALQGPIYRLAQRMLGHPADAEDSTQEILVLVVTHLAQFRGDAKLLTWVYTIATRHLLRARAARAEVRPTRVEDVVQAIEAGLAITQDVAGLAQGEARVLSRDVQRTCTQAMLMCLTREERIAVLLADLLGASDAIGAEICDIEPDAFRQRLARGRAKLRPVLEERCGLVEPARPCRCARQVVAKQRAGLRLPVYRDAVAGEAGEGGSGELERGGDRDGGGDGDRAVDRAVDRANEQLGNLRRLGGVLGVDPPPAPRAVLWAELAARIPDLLS